MRQFGNGEATCDAHPLPLGRCWPQVLARIKEVVSALPPATEEDEQALEELRGGAGSSSSDDSDDGGDGGPQHRQGGSGVGPSSRAGGGGYVAAATSGSGRADVEDEAGPSEAAGSYACPAPGPAPHPASAAGGAVDDDDDEADPFGLDQFLPAPKRPPPPPPPPPPPATARSPAPEDATAQERGRGRGSHSTGAAWTAPQSVVMRRQALIECLITSRSFHKTPWARTGVELLVEHYARHRDRFTAEQLSAVEEMVRFVRAARQARPTGPSQKEINRDTTSFERARAEWSRATVSTRGKIGASGDAKSNNWLG